MSRQRLQETLERLHEELEQTRKIDEGSRELLQQVMGEIKELLERADDSPSAAEVSDPSLLERVERNIEHFEEEHPGIAGLISNLSESLRGMGF